MGFLGRKIYFLLSGPESNDDKTRLILILQYIVYIETNHLIIPILLILDFNFLITMHYYA
jgi:hypothetical protein